MIFTAFWIHSYVNAWTLKMLEHIFPLGINSDASVILLINEIMKPHLILITSITPLTHPWLPSLVWSSQWWFTVSLLAPSSSSTAQPSPCPLCAPAGLASTLMTWIPRLHRNLPQNGHRGSCTFVYHEVWRVCCSGMKVTLEWCAWVASQWQCKYECVYMCVYTICLSIYTCAVPQNDFIACLSLSEYVCIFVHHVILHSFPLRIRPFISRSPCVGVSHGANEERTEQGRVGEWGGRESKNRLFRWQKRGDSDR